MQKLKERTSGLEGHITSMEDEIATLTWNIHQSQATLNSQEQLSASLVYHNAQDSKAIGFNLNLVNCYLR